MLETLHDVVDGSFPIGCPVTLAKQILLFLTRLIDRHPMATMWTVLATGLVAALGVLTGIAWLTWSLVR
jgi:hypothetical protein